jgi:hypothetical protein
MSEPTVIASAGNTIPAALACLRASGFAVTVSGNGRLWNAESANLKLIAEDPLTLLGLAKLYESRGAMWAPSDDEVQQHLELDATRHPSTREDRADVWEDGGVVHMICVSPFGDPVELGEVESEEFAARLEVARRKASGSEG